MAFTVSSSFIEFNLWVILFFSVSIYVVLEADSFISVVLTSDLQCYECPSALM